METAVLPHMLTHTHVHWPGHSPAGCSRSVPRDQRTASGVPHFTVTAPGAEAGSLLETWCPLPVAAPRVLGLVGGVSPAQHWSRNPALGEPKPGSRGPHPTAIHRSSWALAFPPSQAEALVCRPWAEALCPHLPGGLTALWPTRCSQFQASACSEAGLGRCHSLITQSGDVSGIVLISVRSTLACQQR